MWPIFLLETHCLNNFCSLSWPPSIYVIDKVICNLVYKFSLNTILHLYTALEESLSRCTSMFDTKKHTNVWEKNFYRGHTDLNHGPIGLQPIALPLSYIPKAYWPVFRSGQHIQWLVKDPWWLFCRVSEYHPKVCHWEEEKRRWYNGQHSCLPSSWSGFDSRPTQYFFPLLGFQASKLCNRLSPKILVSMNLQTKVFRYRELNPGHLGESQVS